MKYTACSIRYSKTATTTLFTWSLFHVVTLGPSGPCAATIVLSIQFRIMSRARLYVTTHGFLRSGNRCGDVEDVHDVSGCLWRPHDSLEHQSHLRLCAYRQAFENTTIKIRRSRAETGVSWQVDTERNSSSRRRVVDTDHHRERAKGDALTIRDR